MTSDVNGTSFLNALLGKAATTSAAAKATNASAATSSATGTSGTGKIGTDEFLTMLVTQLKNQDPLDPMKNDQFAVDLAQFSQLEKLVSIDNKLGANNGDASSFAAYLGHEVTLNSNKVSVSNGDGGKAQYELVARSNNVRVQLVAADGSVAANLPQGTQQAGSHDVSLTGLSVPPGEYTLRVLAATPTGTDAEVHSNAAGVVTGFIPGPDASLLIGDRQIKPGDISRVQAVSSK